jgi:hypothetical protein
MKGPRKLISGIGLAWALLCLVVVLATFVGLNFWDQALVQATGIHVSPRFSGGEIRQTIEHGSHRTLLHRLVFDGLIADRAAGFVQIDWVPQEGRTLPSVLEEEFDVDGDGTVDIRVRLDTSAGKAELLQRTSWVLGLDPLIAADSERILRVQLRKPQK